MALSKQVKLRRDENRIRRRAWANQEARESGRRLRALIQEVAQRTANAAVEKILGRQWYDNLPPHGHTTTALFRPGLTQSMTEAARAALVNIEKDYAEFVDDSKISPKLQLTSKITDTTKE